jgi:hypothetical protein
VAAAAAAAYSSPPRAQQQQHQEQQQQHSPPPPPPPRAASPPPARPPHEQQDAASSSSLTPLLAALWESLLRLALRLSGLSDAVWARAVAAAGGGGGPFAAATSTTTTTTAPRLALALNGALARVSRSAQAALGVPFLKPSLREIATYVRAVEIEACSSSSPSSSALLSRQDADAALALCVRHSLPAFFRAFWRRYAVDAATGALAVGFARDVLLPVLLILWPLRLFGALARCLLALPFVSGPILGAAVACGSQVHGDPIWAFTEFSSWVQGRVGAAASPEGAPSSAPAAPSASFAAEGWADGGADVDMVDELLAEASAYLDALNNSSRRRAGGAGGVRAGDDAPAAVAADLGARVLRALRHRRAAAAAAAAPPAGAAD